MKTALTLSLILNAILGFLYYQEKSRPPLERIVVEEKMVVKEVSSVHPEPKIPKVPVKKEEVPGGEDFQPIIPGDEHGIQMAVEDLESIKKDFFQKLDIPEATLKKKDQIMQDLYKKTMPIYQKHPTGVTLSFEERRKLIDLEEEAQKQIRSVFGEKKWNAYKNFVDRHNKKIIEASKTGEYTGVLMGY